MLKIVYNQVQTYYLYTNNAKVIIILSFVISYVNLGYKCYRAVQPIPRGKEKNT